MTTLTITHNYHTQTLDLSNISPAEEEKLKNATTLSIQLQDQTAYLNATEINNLERILNMFPRLIQNSTTHYLNIETSNITIQNCNTYYDGSNKLNKERDKELIFKTILKAINKEQHSAQDIITQLKDLYNNFILLDEDRAQGTDDNKILDRNRPLSAILQDLKNDTKLITGLCNQHIKGKNNSVALDSSLKQKPVARLVSNIQNLIDRVIVRLQNDPIKKANAQARIEVRALRNTLKKAVPNNTSQSPQHALPALGSHREKKDKKGHSMLI